jgi:hypothetical protein
MGASSTLKIIKKKKRIEKVTTPQNRRGQKLKKTRNHSML